MADVREAVEFLRQVNDAESDNRMKGIEDLKFRFGDQWPQYAVTSRGLERPQLTINEIDSYCRQVTNMQRQQRPRGKAHPVDDRADVKVAKVITGIGRHIEVASDADYAYDTAFESAVTIGWGYWRMRTDYIREDSFDQSIYIDCIDNPFTVYFDPKSTEPDGSDATQGLITDMMAIKAFENQYPGAQSVGFTERGSGDDEPDWITTESIRIAEYYYIDRKKAKLVKLNDNTVIWEDRLPPKDIMIAAGIEVVGERDSVQKVVKWCKQTAFEILEEKDLHGRYIPIIPVYGSVMVVDGKRERMGMVRFGKDPQRMLNFWQTSITESIALAPKAKWLAVEGTVEGHENEFSSANLSANPLLQYKQTDVTGAPAPAPIRLQPEPPPAGAIQASFMASQNLQKVLGIFDPVMQSNDPKSGKAIIAEKMQAENSNYHFYDNLTRSIKHTWRIILDWTPYVYDTQRVQRIIGDDGKPELVTINQKEVKQDETGAAIEKVLNCVCVGEYDVVMETGPGYDTKRQEGVAATMELMRTPIGEKVAAVADDLIVRQMDFPGADTIADRLAAANPLSEVDEKSDVPPQAQMVMKAMQKQLEQAKQIIQQLEMEKKYRLDAIRMQEDGETRRKLMDTTASAHDTEQRNLSMQHSVEAKAITSQNVEEIRALTKLLIAKLPPEPLENAIASRNVEQQIKHAEQASPPDLSQMQTPPMPPQQGMPPLQ
jgi:hypothetical protein